MKYSRFFGKTQREIPKNAGTLSQQLLLRAGLIRPVGPGTFLLLPLGWRVLQHADHIVAGEAAARGIQPVEAPPVAPGAAKERAANADLRRALAACRPQLRQQYFMASQHEEDLSLLPGALPMTYKELPVMIGIRQWRHREENRGQGSLASARQFLAHAAYCFDADAAGAEQSFGLLREACQFAVRQMGVEVVVVHNRPESPGTPVSDEIVALSDSGDEEIVLCETCEYRAISDRAQSLFPKFGQQENPLPLEAVFGPGIVGTAELAAFVGIPVEKTTKALLFQSDNAVVEVCVRGEYDVSEAKLAEILGCTQLKLAPPAVIRDLTGAEVGYAGPIGLPGTVKLVWDPTTAGRVNFECGANRTDYHNINVNFGRDLEQPEKYFDVRRIKEGEICAQCGLGRLMVRRATRLGHITRLGKMYARELKATFASADGKSEPMLITCAGIDMMRVLTTLVEQHHDSKGILWPRPVAPFLVHMVSLPGVVVRAGEIYAKLEQAGIAVLWDDRDAPAGAKFGDADLIGIPIRLVISTRTGDKLEWKERGGEVTELLPMEDVLRRLIDLK